ncbi:hypothetical protein LR48_Vigan02g052000 [Vigna angularis]|uniref:Uncharacterized protein n=1 Tax=Phaseolus angularis TaxID=3914 RepID=A0A0L9TUY2_PHAAN|nr:hypothetical protein LR48_Vigan02g052000 [Vigna angularis]
MRLKILATTPASQSPCGLVRRNGDDNPCLQVAPTDEEKTTIYWRRKWQGRKRGLALHPTTLAEREWVAATDFGRRGITLFLSAGLNVRNERMGKVLPRTLLSFAAPSLQVWLLLWENVATLGRKGGSVACQVESEGP